MAIQRYVVTITGGLDRSEEGYIVTHEDHLAALREQRMGIAHNVDLVLNGFRTLGIRARHRIIDAIRSYDGGRKEE